MSDEDRVRAATDLARERLRESIDVKEALIASSLPDLIAVADVLAACVERRGTIYLCGNGGSAADAQHIAAEFLIRFRAEPPRGPIAAVPLATDSSSLTACGNDLGFDQYFERMVQALVSSSDALVAITTSGRSANVVRALSAAREIGASTVGFLGGDGGEARDLCDQSIVVPSRTTARIQEAHIACAHVVVELVEDRLASSPETASPSES